MARPNKHTVDYFPHSCLPGKTLYILQNRYRNDGYAFWFKLLEILGVTSNHVYDYNNPANWQYLVAKTMVSEDIAKEIMQTLADLDAIDPELYQKKIIWVQKFVDGVADVYKRRNELPPQRPGGTIPAPIIPPSPFHEVTAETPIIDPDLADLNTSYEKSFGQLITRPISEKLSDLREDYTIDSIKEAMNTAILAGKRSMKYVEGILRNQKENPNGDHERYASSGLEYELVTPEPPPKKVPPVK